MVASDHRALDAVGVHQEAGAWVHQVLAVIVAVTTFTLIVPNLLQSPSVFCRCMRAVLSALVLEEYPVVSVLFFFFFWGGSAILY